MLNNSFLVPLFNVPSTPNICSVLILSFSKSIKYLTYTKATLKILKYFWLQVHWSETKPIFFNRFFTNETVIFKKEMKELTVLYLSLDYYQSQGFEIGFAKYLLNLFFWRNYFTFSIIISLNFIFLRLMIF